MVPKKLFFTKGNGVHKDYLQSFELALRDAGIEKCNLVSVSSILPPNCKIISKDKGLKYMQPGAVTFVVMSRNSTNEPNRLIASSIGVAVPADGSNYGYLSEHHSYGQNRQIAGDYAEDLAATMLATTLGVEFDPDKAYDERKQQYSMSGKIVRASSITQTATGDKDGKWTTVITAAVFVDDESIERVEKAATQPHDKETEKMDLSQIDKDNTNHHPSA